MTLLSVLPIALMPTHSEPNTDVIEFRIKIQRMHASLAADPRPSDSSKRSSQVSQEPAVHPSDAHIHLLRHTMPALQVTGPDRCGQAVLGIIRHVHNLFFRIERRDVANRPEDLFFYAPRRFRKPSKNCGLNKETVVESVTKCWQTRADHDLSTFFARQLVR